MATYKWLVTVKFNGNLTEEDRSDFACELLASLPRLAKTNGGEDVVFSDGAEIEPAAKEEKYGK